MNRRAIRLVPLALAFATVGALLAPAVATADPISDKQAEAAQLESQISTNAEKLSTINEQINSALNQLAVANADIKAADDLVTAAEEKTKELRSEVARRAAAVYTQSGSTGGVEELDASNAQELSTRQKYSSLAAQRDQQIVNQLARAKEQLAARKADAEQARQAAQDQADAIQAQKDKLDAGQADLVKLQSKVTGELAGLVQKAEEERQAREAAAARAQYGALLQSAPAADSGGGGGGGRRRRRRRFGHASTHERWRERGARLRLRPARQALLLRGRRPRVLRLLGPDHEAWAQAGVMMSHGSYDQQASFPAVSMDQLQPGDLVFWDGHVGIYVGGGQRDPCAPHGDLRPDHRHLARRHRCSPSRRRADTTHRVLARRGLRLQAVPRRPAHVLGLVRGFGDAPTDPNLLVGLDTADDAAVYRLRDDLAIVVTTDFFTPIVDDPYDWGRIAATNALSDVYAMGGAPLLALNLVAWPREGLPFELLARVLDGGNDVVRAGRRDRRRRALHRRRRTEVRARGRGHRRPRTGADQPRRARRRRARAHQADRPRRDLHRVEARRRARGARRRGDPGDDDAQRRRP